MVEGEEAVAVEAEVDQVGYKHYLPWRTFISSSSHQEAEEEDSEVAGEHPGVVVGSGGEEEVVEDSEGAGVEGASGVAEGAEDFKHFNFAFFGIHSASADLLFFSAITEKHGEAGKQEKIVEESAGHEGECLSLS